MTNNKDEKFNWVKVEETKVVDTNSIKTPNVDLSDEYLEKMSLDELIYTLNFEKHSSDEKKRIKKAIKAKK